MSIFQQKYCPQCSDRQPMSAPRCGCGYLFEVEANGDDTHAVELEAQQERIYLDYLTARTAQAEEAYRVARRLLEADPESVVKSADVLVAQQQMHAARTELASQTIKARAAMARAQALRKPKPTTVLVKTPESPRPEVRTPIPPKAASATLSAKPIAAPAPVRPDASATPSQQGDASVLQDVTPVTAKRAITGQVAAEATASPIRPAHGSPKPPPAIEPEQPIGPAVTEAPDAPHPPVVDGPGGRGAAPTAATADTPPPAQATADNAPHTNASATAPQPAAQEKRAPAPTPAVTARDPATPSAQPTPAFREAQAAKAKNIVARRKSTSKSGAPRAKTPTPLKPARQPAPASAVEETKDCPSCTATVALPVMRCRCGFAFSHGVELPGVVLTPADRASLLQGFELTSPRKLARPPAK